MKKRVVTVMSVVLALAIVLSAGVALAGNNSQMPSAKATAQISHIAVIDSGDQDWTPILTQTIKTPNQKDLLIDVSLQSGLYTMTKVKGKKGDTDTATASATVKVRVKVDGTSAYPGDAGVVFNERQQELTAVLGGVLTCTDTNGDGIIQYSECTWTDEEIELILSTMSANSFNFIVADLTAGPHTVVVEAMIAASEAIPDKSEAKATIGMGSVTIEQVRMIQGEDWCVGSDDLPCPE